MKINRATLLPYLKTAFDLAADKSPLELFALVRLVSVGEVLFIEATNGNAGLSLRYDGRFDGEIDLFVPSLFYENCLKLTSEEIELEVKGDKLTIKGGKTKPSCAVAPATPERLAQWPDFSEGDDGQEYAVIAEEELKRGLEIALMATSNNTPDEIQGAPHRGNLLLKFANDAFEVGGVHVYGFSRYLTPDAHQQNKQFTLLGTHAKKILPLLKGNNEAEIYVSGNRTYFRLSQATFWTSRVAGSYPHYWQAIPQNLTVNLDLPYSQVREFLDTALSLYNRGGSERIAFLLTLENGILKMLYEGETGQTESEFEVEVPGSLRLGINLKTTSALYKKGVRIHLSETPGSPILLSSEDEKVLHLMSSFHL